MTLSSFGLTSALSNSTLVCSSVHKPYALSSARVTSPSLTAPGVASMDTTIFLESAIIAIISSAVRFLKASVEIDHVGGFPVGVFPVGVFPVGVFPVGVVPVGVVPVGVFPVGVFPVGVVPVGGFPVGVVPGWVDLFWVVPVGVVTVIGGVVVFVSVPYVFKLFSINDNNGPSSTMATDGRKRNS